LNTKQAVFGIEAARASVAATKVTTTQLKITMKNTLASRAVNDLADHFLCAAELMEDISHQ
jgi:hypothetical protein